ncbi:hypothetical protein ACTMTJ_15760 [Phytohabitans sp. LJ34]|uniref:Tc toxin subunit A-related protein n=1 Tax=Phytohabitans sp. LJ34 TaxID=3452217 RepID=UPI003F88A27B
MTISRDRATADGGAEVFIIPPPPGDPGPPDDPPRVSISVVSSRVVAGIAATVRVNAFRGATYAWDPINGGWKGTPIVTYNQTRVFMDGVERIREGRSGGDFSLTFPSHGAHTIRADAVTTGGQVIQGGTVNVQVAAADPPGFTITGPAAGATVDLNDGGGQVTLQVSVASGAYFPVTVAIDRDGQRFSTEQISTTSYSKVVTLGPMPLGARTVAVTVSDRDNLASTKTRTVTGRDVGKPQLQVAFPQPSANVIGDANGNVVVQMTGTAGDNQSGMTGGSAGVAWALSPGGTRTPAQALTGNDFRTWRADVPLSGFGAHTIYVWATDAAGNTVGNPVAVPVVVISSYVPATLEERLSEREYLEALLSFAQEQIRVPGTPEAPLTTATLVGVLRQPLDRLSQPLSAAADRGTQEVNQLRVPIELLRAHIAATGTSTAPGAAGELDYRTAAYTSLLAAVGTSHAELRLARGAAPAVREALAARLGIRLSATRPDELDQLVLDGAALTETALETLFGLASTANPDPLRAPTTPLLLAWQRAALSLSWADEDRAPGGDRAFGALADPDVVGADDVVAGPAGDPIRTLLTQRATTLTAHEQALDAIRTGNPNAAQALAAMVTQTIPGADLAAWETDEGKGVDISGRLAAAGLTLVGFRVLRGLARLAAAGTLTAAEWNDGIAVLTGARRRQQFTAWRAQETGIVLSPDYFVMTGAGPRVSPYREHGDAREDWQSVLRTRIAQRDDLAVANARAVAAAEQAALPILRDALLADLAPATTGDVGEEMTARYLVDMLASGALRTTRIRQAIESVQSLLSAKRSGELLAGHPAFGWTLTNPATFTAAWVWMGEIGSWQAATMAFLFAERHLDPAVLVPGGRQQLRTFFESIRGSGPFTADDAAAAAAAYVSSVSMSFTYLNPTRSTTKQTQMRDLSRTKAEPERREIFWVVPLLLAQRLQSAGDHRAALDWYWIVYPYDVGAPVSIYDRINTETPFRPNLTFPPQWTSMLDPFALVENRPTPYTRYTLLSLIRCHIEFADVEFTRETDESIAHARSLYLAARRLLGAAALRPQQPTNQGEPTLPIPELAALRTRVDVQLAKLRQGRNIAGLSRTQGFVGAMTVSQPTPYRFKVLMERARQLTALAGQMEAGYLAALEKYDERNLRLFDALKGIDLTSAQINLAASRVQEARDSVKAAEAQRTKAGVMTRTYERQINMPPNKYERDLLDQFQEMKSIRNQINVVDTAVGVMQAASAASSFMDALFSGGAKQVLAMAISGAVAAKGVIVANQNNLQAQMDANQLKAGIEQRRDEWRLAKISSEQDSLVAAAQVVVANDHVAITLQEEAIATLQHDQAVATLKFLNDQFTNADLYLWMSNTLGGVYRYFLQQATATARLAQAQLAFERAEATQTLIRNDYWQTPADLTAGGPQVNRRGLTGAEQLSQDLTRLDEYAFSSERRRLNLTQTFSLAQLMPVEFLEFRRTGALAFATPMALFDADFPGHYLRMIRQVRTSIVALVPPDRGIRATLSSNGISRVITRQSDTFKDIVVRHEPGTVALTSAMGASGVFELDAQSEMLLPFESSGVDTTWELQLPRAANPFDYSTIADVLITIDYTALHDEGYRGQVVTRLNANRERGSDRVFSLANDFPDQWYDLNNPPDPASRSVTLDLRAVDFPLDIEDLVTAAVAVRLASGEPVPATVVSLRRGTAGGDATTTDGIASTRRGNAAGWTSLYGTSPAGEWRLAFGADAAGLFTGGRLDDITLVVSWTGRGPAWPAQT